MVKVSIIVPIYNVEKYLVRCLNSLVYQTEKDIEIILVNDASQDNSSSIMQEYKKQFPEKIKCIYLDENLCLGGARNRGLEAAIGEYITFVDSDDWIDLTMCEAMYKKAKKYNSDIIFCDYTLIWENTGNRKNRTFANETQLGDITKEKLKSLLFADHYAWGKLIRRTTIIENNIKFPEHKMYEDIPTTRFYLFYSKRIDKVDACFYYYFQRDTSITHHLDAKYQYDEAEMALLFYDECKKRRFTDEYMDEILMLFTLLFYLYPLNSCFIRFTNPPISYMKYLSDKIKEVYPNYLENKYIKRIAEVKLVEMARANDVSPHYLVEVCKNKILNSNSLYINFYEQNRVKLRQVFNLAYLNKWKLAIWGAGIKGYNLLEFCSKNNFIIDYVIDKSLDKIGQQINSSHIIKNFDEIKDEIDIILVVNNYFFYDIKTEVNNKEPRIKILNLDSYILYDLEFELWL